MKKTSILLILAFLVLTTSAQKIKQTNGKADFLKGQTELSVEFVYPDDMKVGKYSEQEYIKSKMEKAEKSEPGKGKVWKEMWLEDRSKHYEPKFIQLFNDVLKDDKVNLQIDKGVESKYVMIVTTTFIEPGFNVGVSKKNSNINLEIDFVDNADPEKVLASYSITKSPGRSAFGGDYDTGVRIAEAYAKAAKEFAKFLIKKKVL